MEWAAFSWRDGILLAVVLAAVYLVVMLLRLTQIGRGKSRPAVEPLADGLPPAPPPQLQQETEAEATPNFEWNEVRSLFGDAPSDAPQASAPRRPAGFGEHLAEHLARSEVEMEVQRMRSEMESMRAEVEQLRASRNVSPQYAEAMELAQRGLTAPQIADRLGISLAEAELVYALSRSDGKFDEGDEHGADRFAT